MESELDQARSIAERIARRVSQDFHNTPNQGDASADLSSELAAMRAGLGDLQRRLSQIEGRVRSGAIEGSGQATVESSPMTLRTYSPWLAGVNASAAHPSHERFEVEAAT